MISIQESIQAIPEIGDWILDYDYDELCAKVVQHLELDDAESLLNVQYYLSTLSHELDQKELIGF